jgi:hypothetical protein
LGGHLLYMTPYKIEALECAELKKRADNATTRARELERVREKASGSAAGPVINTMVYGPDYTKARWELRLYEEQLALKNCDAPALPPPPLDIRR